MLIKVHDPKNTDDFLLVNKKQFEEGGYALFSEKPKVAVKKAAPKAAAKPAPKKAPAKKASK